MLGSIIRKYSIFICLFLLWGINKSYDVVAQSKEEVLNSGIQEYKEENYKRAITQLSPLLSQYDTNRIDTFNLELFAYLSKSYAADSQFEQAYKFFMKHQKIMDSLLILDKLQRINTTTNQIDSLNLQEKAAIKQIELNKNNEKINKNRYQIAGVITGILLLILLCFVSIKSYFHKKKLFLNTQKNIQRKAALAELNANMDGIIQERNRIKKYIQKEVNPLVNNIEKRLHTLSKITGTPIIESTGFLKVKKIIKEVTQELEDTSLQLSLSQIESEGLVFGVQQLTKNITQDYPLAVSFQHSGHNNLRPHIEKSLFRIIQELVQNIIKHAQATKATIDLKFRKEDTLLIIEDNGIGRINEEEVNYTGNGLGLESVHQRIHKLNGTIDIDTKNGFLITIIIPNNLSNLY